MGNFPSSKEMVYLSFGFVFILTTFTFGNFLFYSLKGKQVASKKGKATNTKKDPSNHKNKLRPTNKSKNSHITEREGCRILVQTMTENVFTLSKNFRTKDKDDRELLERMRTGDQTIEDAERLINLHLKNYSQDFIDKISDDPKTLYAFARRDDMKKKNDELLIKTHNRRNVPIARLNCVFDNHKGNNAIPRHFYGKKILYNLDLCEGALVCLEGVNINPNAGLYVGSIGKVVEIVYDEQHTVGPNGDKQTKMSHLPSYIVVDFPNFKPPQGLSVWDEENPTVSEHIISPGLTQRDFVILEISNSTIPD